MSTAKLLIFSLATEKCGRHKLTRDSIKCEIVKWRNAESMLMRSWRVEAVVRLDTTPQVFVVQREQRS